MEVLSTAAQKFDAKIQLNQSVKKILVDNGTAKGVIFQNNKVEKFDHLILTLILLTQ